MYCVNNVDYGVLVTAVGVYRALGIDTVCTKVWFYILKSKKTPVTWRQSERPREVSL